MGTWGEGGGGNTPVPCCPDGHCPAGFSVVNGEGMEISRKPVQHLKKGCNRITCTRATPCPPLKKRVLRTVVRSCQGTDPLVIGADGP
jgi:hypothetical protein